MERPEIERSDFPLVRRGYDREAVQLHLRAVAEELERLQGEIAAGGGAASESAAEQVRGILAAAEAAADDIRRRANEHARETLARAEREAAGVRAGAGEALRLQAAGVARLTAELLGRGSDDAELRALADELRRGAQRLEAVGGEEAEGAGALSPAESANGAASHPPAEPAPQLGHAASDRAADTPPHDDAPHAPAHEAAAPDVSAPPVRSRRTRRRAAEPVAATASELPASAAAAGAPAGQADEAATGAATDLDGARLVALDMALNGEPREATERYLAENFELPDRAALVEEVYAAIGG